MRPWKSPLEKACWDFGRLSLVRAAELQPVCVVVQARHLQRRLGRGVLVLTALLEGKTYQRHTRGCKQIVPTRFLSCG